MFLRNYYTASILLMVVLLTYNNIMNINNCSFLLESDRISYVLVCILHSTYLYMVCRINIVLYNYIMKQFVCLPISTFPYGMVAALPGQTFQSLIFYTSLRSYEITINTSQLVFSYSPTRETFLLLTDSNSVPDGNVLSSFGTATKSSGTLSQSPPLP